MTARPTAAPSPCPSCGGPREWDIDMADTAAEWSRWCAPCGLSDFPSEDAPRPSAVHPDVLAAAVRARLARDGGTPTPARVAAALRDEGAGLLGDIAVLEVLRALQQQEQQDSPSVRARLAARRRARRVARVSVVLAASDVMDGDIVCLSDTFDVHHVVQRTGAAAGPPMTAAWQRYAPADLGLIPWREVIGVNENPDEIAASDLLCPPVESDGRYVLLTVSDPSPKDPHALKLLLVGALQPVHVLSCSATSDGA